MLERCSPVPLLPILVTWLPEPPKTSGCPERGAAGLLAAQEAMFCSRIPLLVLVVGCLNPNSGVRGVRTVLEQC